MEFGSLPGADLIVDAIYEGGTAGTTADDPLALLLPVGNQGGFRYRTVAGEVRLVALYTTGTEPDWPDALDSELGELTYFGDNRHPGHELHDTRRGGNRMLREHFTGAQGVAEDRRRIPPYFLFEKTGTGRDIRFRGLLVPGSSRLSPVEDLVAVWRHVRGDRFQNYRATFTVLATPVVTRAWIQDILAGDNLSTHCPPEWRTWVESNTAHVLRAAPSRVVRSREEQLPAEPGLQILATITSYFREWPQGFEDGRGRRDQTMA